jgi:hypothetical protein
VIKKASIYSICAENTVCADETNSASSASTTKFEARARAIVSDLTLKLSFFPQQLLIDKQAVVLQKRKDEVYLFGVLCFLLHTCI